MRLYLHDALHSHTQVYQKLLVIFVKLPGQARAKMTQTIW